MAIQKKALVFTSILFLGLKPEAIQKTGTIHHAEGYTNVLDELDKASRALPAKESEELVSIINELAEIPTEVAPEKSKNLFTKALDRLKDFPKTIDSEAEKLVSKKLIIDGWKQLQGVYDAIDWDRIIKLGKDAWDAGKHFLDKVKH